MASSPPMPKARVMFMNPIAEQLTGWTSEEAVSRRVPEVFVIVDDVSGEAALDPVMESLRRQQLST